jgi:hypothetical protein
MRKLLLTVAFLFTSMTAMAAEHVTVRANKTSAIGSYVSYNRDLCSGDGIPQMRVGRKPKHGKVTFKPISTKFRRGPCKGRPVKVAAAFYTPDRGFKGKDNFSVYFRHELYEGAAGWTTTSYSYQVTVK